MKQAGTKHSLAPTKTIGQRQWWIISTFVAVVVLLSPILALFPQLFTPTGTAWKNLQETVLLEYTLNTLILIFGVGLCTLVLGTSLAILTSLFTFPGSRFLRFGLLLPLALPSYIAAYVFAGMTDYSGPLHQLGRVFGFQDLHFNIMNKFGLIVILSLVLYPYVFATARVSLESRYNSLVENARALGLKGSALLFKIILPLIRPALIGGLFLVMMEVLNDYGAMKYFGVATFTTGIFSAWFSMNDLNSAVRLAMLLFFAVGLMSFAESWFSKSHKVVESNRSSVTTKKKLVGIKALLAACFTWSVFFVAFIAPILFLLWTLQYADHERAINEWFSLAGNSLVSGLAGVVAVLFIVLLTQFTRQLIQSRLTAVLGRSISIGYTLPGAIIAIGIILLSSFFDGILNQGLLLTGSFGMLIFAYAVRFSGVAFQPLQAESEKRSGKLFEAAQSLGLKPMRILKNIFLPLSLNGILLGATLVLIDILKELPLTLILRPSNFSTLATKAFEYADDELLSKAALPALSVILVGLIPVLLLHRMLRAK
ncbi:MAG: iron(III) transport system permease protein [Flavobacteriales bacterium]|jgi:iron(III) transport system permease protein